MIVIYLAIYLRNPSFPRTQKQKLPPSLKNLHSFLESGLMSERPHAHMVYIPTELYVGLFKKMGSLEIGMSAAILDALNEDLYRRGFIDEETYLKFKERYSRKLIEIVREKEQSSVKVEFSSAKLEVEVSKPKKRPDYSKMSLEDLEKLRNELLERGETSELQHVAWEIKKRLAEKGVTA
jgi:hypothetical protein